MESEINYFVGELYILKDNIVDEIVKESGFEWLKDLEIGSVAANSFWQITPVDENNVKLQLMCRNINLEYYMSLEEAKKSFVKLTNFLKSANYIGRSISSTKRVENNFNVELYSDLNMKDKIIALFENDNILLIKNGEEYQLLDANSINDGNHKLSSYNFPEYNDIPYILREIYLQENGKSRRR